MQYDVIIIGGGPGGYVAALKAAQKNLKTLIIEKEWWGGVCLNVGCIPTKALLKSAKVFSTFKKAKTFGINVDETTLIPDWTTMQDRKQTIVKKLTQGIEFLLKKNQIEKVIGTAEVIDKNTVLVNGVIYQTDNLILATGSQAKNLDLPGFAAAQQEKFLLTSQEILELKTLPKKLTIIGAGVIGIEFACLFSALGTEVTIVQGASKILELLDHDISIEMTKILEAQNIKIEVNAKLKQIKERTLFFEQDGHEKELLSDFILLCVGRSPVRNAFAKLQLALNQKKHLQIDENCQTSLPNVYAIGDVVGYNMLAHVASAQAIIAVEHIANANKSISLEYIPNCIYSFPEIASVGLNEQQCQEQGLPVTSYKFSLASNGKAMIEGETNGFAKILANKDTGEIYGAHLIADNATEMITEITATMVSEGTVYELIKTIHPHPTRSEIIMEAANGVIDRPIHS